MTPQDIQKLKADADAARAAAKLAAEQAAAEPTDATKKAAAEETARRSADLDAALGAAAAGARATAVYLSHVPTTDTSQEIAFYKYRIVLLLVYLLLLLLSSIYLLTRTMMATTGEEEVKKILVEKSCCNQLSNSNRNANSNANLNESANVDANSTSARLANDIADANSNANASLNANTNSTTNSNTKANTSSNEISNGKSTSASNANANTTQPADPNKPEPNISKDVYIDIPFFLSEKVISADSYLFLVVLFSGVLGGSIRGIQSLARHLGLKDFSIHWTWFYISLPFVGGGLSEVIYFVIRGGFYGGSVGKGLVLNVFSFAALAALTGLFTEQAMEKLKKVATTLLEDTPPKVDNANEIQARRDAEKKKV